MPVFAALSFFVWRPLAQRLLEGMFGGVRMIYRQWRPAKPKPERLVAQTVPCAGMAR
ncbi:hypothetical protein OS189_07905 [Sulfitobacter sp. F26169L]|uniref:hypothetical protein n=1 Tax=Sulfitobacter sp. F26169L TaxID=2996015 RepID=UPI002260AE07|nr:hypothetical protein [Sulfitobacter sp. F26169L]MCX7566264.1 hypothetical protein [Sulfitobacter sp. F26169L]